MALARLEHLEGESNMAHRRGRRSQDEYLELVVSLIRADLWQLKDEKTFAEYAGIKAVAAHFVGEAWPLALAFQVLIAAAVSDVRAACNAAPTRQARRFEEFLRLWYDERHSVTAVAATVHLSRAHVAKAIQRPALLLVAQRFLVLAQQVEPEAHSEGLRHALRDARLSRVISSPDQMSPSIWHTRRGAQSA